jgi:membrane protease YdiL (CAAX protease family)
MVTITRPRAAEPAVHEGVVQHSVPTTIAYHLLPGLLILAVTVAAVPLVRAAGLPGIAAVLVAMVVQLPILLGHLIRLGWRRNGRLSLAGVVLYRRPLPRWQYPLWGVGVTVWGVVMYWVFQPITQFLTDLFRWVPPDLLSGEVADYTGFSKSALLVTFGGMLILNGLIAPPIEEMYFRGYLLPRLSRLGWKAPLLETVLFVLYHVWQPWNYVYTLFTMAAWIFPAYRAKNLYIGVWAHTMLNVTGGVTILLMALGR